MNRRKRPQHVLTPSADPVRIQQEIDYLELRLSEIGYDGDCGYENAMVRFFEQQVDLRRAWLATRQTVTVAHAQYSR